MEQLRVTLKVTVPRKQFSEAFKRQVVKEFEAGILNKDQLKAKYGLGGHSTVLKWCRKYGRFAYATPTKNGRPMKNPLQQRIKELENKLKAAEQKLKVYDKLIEITNRELNTDIVKKIEAKLSGNWQQKKG